MIDEMVGKGRASIATITAKRFGITDERLLKVIARVASAEIQFTGHKLQTDKDKNQYHVFHGLMDGKNFTLVVGGAAIADFAD